jgi:hypothetical protein
MAIQLVVVPVTNLVGRREGGDGVEARSKGKKKV